MCVCVCSCVLMAEWYICARVVYWWLSGIHSELPIEGLRVGDSRPASGIWCSVFLLAAVAAVTI